MAFNTDDDTAWQHTARRAFATRRVSANAIASCAIDPSRQPVRDDLMLCQVQAVGNPEQLQDIDGQPQALHAGDLVMVIFDPHDPRPAQAAAAVDDLAPYRLSTIGGCAEAVHGTGHDAVTQTLLQPLGLLVDPAGRTVNGRRYGLDSVVLGQRERPQVIAVFGSGHRYSDSGATASLIRGLHAKGRQVGVARVSGSSNAAHVLGFRAAGACSALDFTDAGHASTRGLGRGERLQVLRTLLTVTITATVDVVVLDFAEYPEDTELVALLDAPELLQKIDDVILATGSGRQGLADAKKLRTAHINVAAVASGRSHMNNRVIACGPCIRRNDAMAKPMHTPMPAPSQAS